MYAELIKLIENPKPYDKGNAVMWTDEYISKQLLELHIDPNHDVASRKPESIDTILRWLFNQIPKESRTILDMGCGPGLYAERIAMNGYDVTGIDISKNSIEYARNSSEMKGLNVQYVCKNYLDLDYEEQYDVIMMIYCDFGALAFDDREIVLRNIFRALKKGGIFIFDALNANIIKSLRLQKDWTVFDHGFWADDPHIVLSQSFHFPDNKATMDQHVIMKDDGDFKVYRFWNHYFDDMDIEGIFSKIGFSKVRSHPGVLKGTEPYNDEGVTFYKVTK